MNAPQYEMAEVIYRFLPSLRPKLSLHQLRTLSALERCRTASLGAHLDACDSCGQVRISYNSCRNRHCPKCQGVNKEMFVIEQEEMLLPVAYYHVVFTLPQELNSLCLYNPKVMYDLLFESAWHTIHTLAKDDKWLGAKPAATMVLHTWSQTLCLHPHVHCIVPDGGLDKEGEWVFPKRGKNGNFLFPVNAMKKLYRGYFMSNLKKKIEGGGLDLPPDFPVGYAYKQWKNVLYGKDWVVYTKKPFSGVNKVIDYLARYSHRVALTNHRIKNITDRKVTFEYKDYKEDAKKKLMTLQGEEFLRRFAQHILPAGFRKVRKYGLVSNASKKKDLPLARKALGQVHIPILSTRKERKAKALDRMFGEEKDRCTCCKLGKMIPLYTLLKEEVEAVESQSSVASDFPQERAPPQQSVLVPPK